MKERVRLQRRAGDEERRNQPSSFRREPQADEDFAPPEVQGALASEGQPLKAEERAPMEQQFGHNFGQVRIHTGAQAAESAKAVGANAYTVGSDIVFGEGQYAPGTASGDRLLAHEMAHVVQQQSASPLTQRKTRAESGEEASGPDGGQAPDRPGKIPLGKTDDPSEQQAEAAAAQVVSGAPVSRNLLAPVSAAAVQRDPPPADPAAGQAATPSAAPVQPSRFNPPPEVPGMMPADAQIVALNPAPLYEAIRGVSWPNYTLTDTAWFGWDQISVLASQSFWAGPNLTNATTGEVIQTLAPEDIPYPGGTLNARVRIKATIKNVTFESADGVGVTQSATGGGSLGGSGSVTTTNTLGASGEISQNKAAGSPSAKGGVSASTATASASTGTVGLAGGATTGAAATEGVRFRFDVDWSVTVEQKLTTGTGTMITTLGMGNLAAYILEKPSQSATATSTGCVVRFPKVRCTPADETAISIKPFTRPS